MIDHHRSVDLRDTGEGADVRLAGDEARRVRGAHALGGHCGDDVHLVGGAAGDEGVGAVHARFGQDLGVGRVAVDHLNIEAIEALGVVRVVLDYDDVVAAMQCTHELLCDVSIARDHDPHAGPLSLAPHPTPAGRPPTRKLIVPPTSPDRCRAGGSRCKQNRRERAAVGSHL